MKQQAVTHTIHQTEISALLDSWVKNTTFVKMLCPQKIASTCIFVKNLTCLNDGSITVLSRFFCHL